MSESIWHKVLLLPGTFSTTEGVGCSLVLQTTLNGRYQVREDSRHLRTGTYMPFVIHGGIIKNWQGQMQVLSKGNPEKHHWFCKKPTAWKTLQHPDPSAYSLIYKANLGRTCHKYDMCPRNLCRTKGKDQGAGYFGPSP